MGWKVYDYRPGQSQQWAELVHPKGFRVEIYLENFFEILKTSILIDGVIQGEWRWEGHKLIKKSIMGVVIKETKTRETLYIVGVNDWQHDIDGGMSQYMITDDYATLSFKKSDGSFGMIETDGTFYILSKEELLKLKENLQNQDDYDLENIDDQVFVLRDFLGKLVLHYGDEDTDEDYLVEIPIGIKERIGDYATIPEVLNNHDNRCSWDAWITGTAGNWIKSRSLAEVLETLVP